MGKEQIYQQIEKFYNSKETQNDSKVIGDKYFYINTQKAIDSTKFINNLINKKKIIFNSSLNIMDLCFGSGNLTSHIVLDTPLNTQNIYFNDIDTTVTNQDIKIEEKSEVLNLDFLDFKQFEKYKKSIDLLIFNPTISDSDIYRKISVKESDKVIEYNNHLDIKVSFKEYCENLSLKIMNDIEINQENKTIKVQIEGTKKLLNKLPNSFNNYSLICKTKSMKSYENRTSIVTQINQTISSLLKDDGIIIFVGTDKQQEVIFQLYNRVFRYLQDEKDVFVISKSEINSIECFEKNQDGFIKNDDCKLIKTNDTKIKSFDKIEVDTFEDENKKELKEENKAMKKQKETEKFINTPLDNDWEFSHKNLLLKGVPGTGKSHTLEQIIENHLNLKDKPKNICHINIHSASSNADLMQGIGINSNGGKIEYKEKQGLIYNHIKKALFTPNQPFVLILEEIQENSLNELIGDLIYLIEVKKRVTVDPTQFEDGKEYGYQEFIEKVLEDKDNKHSIQIPYLVDTSTDYRKMVLPSNLYIFCTSNYRDDKKVIEDNLLRRFDVVEVYPKYKGVLKSDDMAKFLEKLNKEILEQFKREMHPDRYLVGHANWLDITDADNDKNKKLFYTALLKVIIEFKEIREVDFDAYVKPILKKLFKNDEHLSTRIEKYLNDCNFDLKSDKYKEIVEKLQSKIYSFL